MLFCGFHHVEIGGFLVTATTVSTRELESELAARSVATFLRNFSWHDYSVVLRRVWHIIPSMVSALQPLSWVAASLASSPAWPPQASFFSGWAGSPCPRPLYINAPERTSANMPTPAPSQGAAPPHIQNSSTFFVRAWGQDYRQLRVRISAGCAPMFIEPLTGASAQEPRARKWSSACRSSSE